MVTIEELLVHIKQRHTEEYCAMYDICGARCDGSFPLYFLASISSNSMECLSASWHTAVVKQIEVDTKFLAFMSSIITTFTLMPSWKLDGSCLDGKGRYVDVDGKGSNQQICCFIFVFVCATIQL